MSTNELREELASIEHERWADWQKYCHSVLRNAPILKLSQEDILVRWDRQINTPYEQLTDKEKASDMEQVNRYWNLIEDHVKSEQKKLLLELLQEMPEKHICDKSCNIRSNEWEVGHRAYKDAESNVLEEVESIIKEKLKEIK